MCCSNLCIRLKLLIVGPNVIDLIVNWIHESSQDSKINSALNKLCLTYRNTPLLDYTFEIIDLLFVLLCFYFNLRFTAPWILCQGLNSIPPQLKFVTIFTQSMS